ncbi:Aste57867_23669 [Aphanomyces stellatus]|uniref:Aste57867_23669 protein n=1 Tax=Aphanomyces stellatus TaxID=120398 RepID=A0A485LNN5_9STRA|nr:hypothetical protein As57867_023597 [Aphanomyces stellatus]VFU00314.1 Aste57867_23669 [Aphanomyces stellatus]
MDESKMNAKDRRKLRRAAELAKEAPKVEEPVVEVPKIKKAPKHVEPVVKEAVVKAETPVVKAEKPVVKAEKPKKAPVKEEEDFIKLPSAVASAAPSTSDDANNAKARRMAMRAAKRVVPEEPVDATSTAKTQRVAKQVEETSTDNADPSGGGDAAANAKARRLERRAAARTTSGATTDETKKPKKVPKRKLKDPDAKSIHLTLFLGQLPFNATEALVRAHFAEAGEIKVRMLTDKTTKKFKGTAFIEVKDSAALGAALARHHSLLNGRRINVELTANGGGTKSELRQTRIKELRDKQKVKQVEKVQALLQKNVDDPDCKLTPDDVDERMTDFLSWFDYDTAKLALEEFNRCVSDRVLNRRAFFMGILKRFRTTDGVEDDRPPKRSDKSKFGGGGGFKRKSEQHAGRPAFKRPRRD